MFVANPNKTPEIVEVLSTNKEKLLKYLGDFHTDKGVCRRKAICKTYLLSACDDYTRPHGMMLGIPWSILEHAKHCVID